MKKSLTFLIIMFSVFFFASSSLSTPLNVTLNKDVSLHGTFFSGGWNGGIVVSEDTVVDGSFLPRYNRWDQGAVWWDTHTPRNNPYITIDLAGIFSIESFIVQADDNDAYKISYWNIDSNSWQDAWDVPNYDGYGWGIQTRPNPSNDNDRYLLAEKIITNALKFEGMDGDGYFSVSEIQAFGEAAPVPEPATMILFGSGLIGLAGLKRKVTK